MSRYFRNRDFQAANLSRFRSMKRLDKASRSRAEQTRSSKGRGSREGRSIEGVMCRNVQKKIFMPSTVVSSIFLLPTPESWTSALLTIFVTFLRCEPILNHVRFPWTISGRLSSFTKQRERRIDKYLLKSRHHICRFTIYMPQSVPS